MLPFPSSAELVRRTPRLIGGLALCGLGIALMVRSDLGLGPWDILHQGVARRTGLTIGTVVIVTGLVVLLAWLPLRQRVGIGTIANALLIGAVANVGLAVIPDASWWPAQVGLMVLGLLGFGVGSGAYIGAGLGTGPRDGLMTGLSRISGLSIRLVRTGIELTVLTIGVLLGGTIGVGTVAFALGIGPLVQLFLGPLSLPPLVPSNPVPTDPHPPL